jgi:hypothetical protein
MKKITTLIVIIIFTISCSKSDENIYEIYKKDLNNSSIIGVWRLQSITTNNQTLNLWDNNNLYNFSDKSVLIETIGFIYKKKKFLILNNELITDEFIKNSFGNNYYNDKFNIIELTNNTMVLKRYYHSKKTGNYPIEEIYFSEKEIETTIYLKQ